MENAAKILFLRKAAVKLLDLLIDLDKTKKCSFSLESSSDILKGCELKGKASKHKL